MIRYLVIIIIVVVVVVQAKWRFSDICKKKILNFTYEDSVEYKGMELLTGTLETILDEPVINVANEISKFGTPIFYCTDRSSSNTLLPG